MKNRCENRRFLMARNHVWRYTLRLFHTCVLFEKLEKSMPKGNPKVVHFGSKNTTLGILFCIDFSMFFRKWQKCEISEEYNAKRGSEPSKTFDFRIEFSIHFNVFSEPPSRDHFWKVQAPMYAQKSDFGPI